MDDIASNTVYDTHIAANEYQKISIYQHNQPNHMSPGELISLLQHINNMYPQKFIVEMTHYYHKESNVTTVEIICTSEKFPGQYTFPQVAYFTGNRHD